LSEASKLLRQDGRFKLFKFLGIAKFGSLERIKRGELDCKEIPRLKVAGIGKVFPL
jgi:hypothetical protein